MKKLATILSSRTVWVFLILFTVNGVTGIREQIPPAVLPIVDAALGLLGVYFRVKPRVDF